MGRTTKAQLAVAAVFPAAAVPTLIPLLRRAAVPDFATGAVIGVLLGLSVVLLALSLRARPA